VEEALDGAEVVVLAKRSSEFRAALSGRTPGQHVIDLAGVVEPGQGKQDGYEGICW
jgi:hypothetical protein